MMPGVIDPLLDVRVCATPDAGLSLTPDVGLDAVRDVTPEVDLLSST